MLLKSAAGIRQAERKRKEAADGEKPGQLSRPLCLLFQRWRPELKSSCRGFRPCAVRQQSAWAPSVDGHMVFKDRLTGVRAGETPAHQVNKCDLLSVPSSGSGASQQRDPRSCWKRPGRGRHRPADQQQHLHEGARPQPVLPRPVLGAPG